MSFIEQFSKIHNNYSTYSKSTFQIDYEKNILHKLEKYSEFNYLVDFYNIFQNSMSNDFSINVNNEQARSRDLPFIGENVLKSGNSKYFFLFEGSLAKDKLSISVFSHLWITNNETIINEFCGKNGWWKKSDYLSIKTKLNITKEIAINSYVTDAIRFNEKNQNTNLIYEEIELFKPKLVICVGSKARDIVGMRYLKGDIKFHHVKFPKYHKETKEYDELKQIMNEFKNHT